MDCTQSFETFTKQAGLLLQPHQVAGVQWCLEHERDGILLGSQYPYSTDPEHKYALPRVQRKKPGYGFKCNALPNVATQKKLRTPSPSPKMESTETISMTQPRRYHCGLIADEMGLGKTIQMLGTIWCNPVRRTLIIMPRVLLEQWESAIKKMTSNFSVIVYHGANVRKYDINDLTAANIVITTYGMIAIRDHRPDSVLHQIEWDRLVADEAHHVRNFKTRASQGMRKLNAKIRWLMTGTPIQNQKKDLYSLCAAMGLPSGYYTKQENLMDFAKKFLLRRTKSEIGLNIPELNDTTVAVEWNSKKEQQLAESIHSELSFSGIEKTNMCASSGASTYCSVLPHLIRARQVCILPSLTKIASTSGMTTSKLDAVCDHLLNPHTRNRPKLVFCHFRGEIDQIVNRTKSRDSTINIRTLDGRAKQSERTQILSETYDILVLQINTGCEGLNLQKYKDVYFVSPHWNPAVEDQAVARCHRMGQDSNVNVYRFIMSDFSRKTPTSTLDNHSSLLQDQKRELATNFNRLVSTM